MKNIEIVELVVESLPGANQGDSMQECMKPAVGRWQNVHLRHNGRGYDIRPNDLLGAIRERP